MTKQLLSCALVTALATTIVFSGCTAEPELRVELIAPAAVRFTDTASVALRIANRSEQPILLTGIPAGDSTRTMQVETVDTDHQVVWRRITALIDWPPGERTLAPGQELVLMVNWTPRDSMGQALAPGQYTIRSFLMNKEGTTNAQRVITIRGA